VLSQKLAFPPFALLVQKPRHEGQQQHRAGDHPDKKIRADRRRRPHHIPQVGTFLGTPGALAALLHQPDHRAFHGGHLAAQAALFSAVAREKRTKPLRRALHAALECQGGIRVKCVGRGRIFWALRKGHGEQHCPCRCGQHQTGFEQKQG